MKRTILFLLFALGCSVDSTGLLPPDASFLDAPDVPSSCAVGESQDCASVGVCQSRRRRCVDGSWGECVEAISGGMDEACDAENLDEDCDGMVNEGCACAEDVACGESSTPPCSLGTQRCVGGVLSSVCEGEVPPQSEMCDGDDNDCDTLVDEGVLNTYFTDADGDGVGTLPMVERCALAEGYVIMGDDCDDMNPDIYPGNLDICDGTNNDCDDFTDEDGEATAYFLDEDEDGFGGASLTTCLDPGEDYVEIGGDCMDMDGDIYPDAEEECDLVDNDCSGTPDDGGACRSSCTAHTYGGHVYQFCQENRDWGQARDRCYELGDEGLYVLVTIDDEDENTFLNARAETTSEGSRWWIGLTDSGGGNEGTYRWQSGTSFSFHNWSVGEPNNASNEDCIQLLSDGRWNDGECRDDQFYVCEEID